MKQFLKSLLIAFCALVAFAPAHADDLCKNLFNKSDFLSLSGYFVNMYGNLINGGGNTTIIFPVQPNTTYTFSWDGYGGGRIAQFEDLPSSGGTAGTNVGNFYNGGTVTTANATNYIAIHFQKTDSALQPFIDSLQQEQGSTATSYVPYNPLCATCQGIIKTYESAVGTVAQNGTPTPTNPIEPTFYTQGDMVLRAVGDSADLKDSYDTATGKITRRVGVKVFNGTEAITVNQTTNNEYIKPDATNGFFITRAVSPATAYSSHFPRGTGAIWSSRGRANQFQLNSPGNGNMQIHLNIANDLLGITDYTQETAETARDKIKAYLKAQYDAGTPVTVYYALPSADYTEETVTSTTYCAPAVKIATTAYNNNAFSSVQTALNSAVSTIKDVVANTITQTAAIAQIASDKQTRPNSACPAGKTCLLVEDMNGEPHWYEIIEEYIPPEEPETP